MPSEAAVKVRNVSKCFKVYPSPFHRIRQRFIPGTKRQYKEIWALNDVSFDVKQGEALGIIGQNGSGKSTLLEIISDTNVPTSGDVAVNGRVAALLELGAGFNPEFTGRENIYTNAAIMGIKEAEIESRFQDIIDFSELQDYIDQPVKTYSSGMYVRLAFAVAINMDPDILIVDEALSVGDIRFQRKCYRKFEEFRRAGRTIIFVTHATDLVVNHCDRAVFLDKGVVRQIGKPRDVVNAYLDYLFGAARDDSPGSAGSLIKPVHPRQKVTTREGGSVVELLSVDTNRDNCIVRATYNPTEYRWGNGKAKILDYLVEDGDNVDPTVCLKGSTIRIHMSACFLEPVAAPIYGLTVKTVDGVTVYGANSRLLKKHCSSVAAGQIKRICYEVTLNLVAGDYFISLGIASDDSEHDNIPLDRRYDLIHLRVQDAGQGFGIADLKMSYIDHDNDGK